MTRKLSVLLTLLAAVLAPRPVRAQGGTVVLAPDSLAVVGSRRVPPATVLAASGLIAGRPVTYRDIQRAIQALYGTGNFDDVQLVQEDREGRAVRVIRVRESPVLMTWAVRGVERLGERGVKDKVSLAEGRPLDPAALERSRARIDSLYRAQGYYLAAVRVVPVYEADSTRVRIVFAVEEGRRVAIAQVAVEGNTHFTDAQIVHEMKSKPEGFWWFRSGEYDDERLAADVQERLPKFYGERGYVDFQVLGDTVEVNDSTGKATLVVRVSEGYPHRIGSFEIVGNRRFSTD